MSDKCPYCGAKIVKTHPITKNNYECGSCGNEDYTAQSRECRNRQISNLTASRDRWKELALCLKEWQEWLEKVIKSKYPDIPAMPERSYPNAIAALKEAGEWED